MGEREQTRTVGGEATAKAAAPRLSLTEQLDDFAVFVAGLVAPKLASHWRDRLAARWAEEQATFASKTDSTKKLYGSKFRKIAKEAVEGSIDFAGGRTGDALDTPELTARAELTKAIHDMPEERRAHVLDALPALLASPRDVLDRLREDYRRKVAAQHRDLIVIEEWEKLVTTLRMMLRSPDPYEKALAIAGCTGRRFREVLQTGVFGPVRETVDGIRMTQRFALTFAGQLKTRGAEGTRHNETYVIPTIAPAKEVLAAINALRQSDEGRKWAAMTADDLNRQVNNKLNDRLSKHRKIVGMWPYGAELTVKTMRDFYAEVAYVAMGRVSESKSAFIARILGHRADDIETSLSYQKFALRGHDEAAMAALRAMEAAFEAQQAQRRAAGLPVAGETAKDEDEDDEGDTGGEGAAQDDPAPAPEVQPEPQPEPAPEAAPVPQADAPAPKRRGRKKAAPSAPAGDAGEVIDPED